MLRKLGTLLFALAALCGGACTNAPAPTLPRDAMVVRRDGGDGGSSDFDAGPPHDSGPMDAARFDGTISPQDDAATVPEDAPKDADPMQDAFTPADSGSDASICGDLCPCPRPASTCGSDGECASGERCITNVCGEGNCEPAGPPCSDELDCAAESACSGEICVRSTPGCADSRDCVAGYECEAGNCVDRRVSCVEVDDCPRGYVCRTGDLFGAGFCVRFHRRCATDAACADFGEGAVCRDVDEDGDRECTRPGSCTVMSDCTGGGTCGVLPTAQRTECTLFGVCRSDADCDPKSSLHCVDLSGQGQPECARMGSCSGPADCPHGQVCATPDRDTPPRCVAGYT